MHHGKASGKQKTHKVLKNTQFLRNQWEM